jgi:hypothetical protein
MKEKVLACDFQHSEHDSILRETANAAKLHAKSLQAEQICTS